MIRDIEVHIIFSVHEAGNMAVHGDESMAKNVGMHVVGNMTGYVACKNSAGNTALHVT